MKVITQLVVVAALAAIGGGGWYYKDRLPFGAAPVANTTGGGLDRAVPVEVAPARSGKVTVAVEAVGTARADEAVTITSKVRGVVTRIAFREGQKVKAGTVLVETDASELQAELEEKRAERDNAQRLYDRAKRLLKTRNVPEAQVDALMGDLEAAEARVRADEARLADYVIRAPFSGRLGLRRVSLGALVEPGDEITTLDDVTPIKLDFEVPETALGRLAPGLQVSARSAALAGRTFSGKVTTIDSRVDPVTRSVAVRAEIPNGDEILKPGMFLNVRLVVATRAEAVLVPEEALISTGSGQFVFVVEGDTAVRTAVTLGQRLPGEVEVLTGLEPGILVVVGGLQKLRDGAPVKPLAPKAAG
jgi:membrane fusion protein (multidrug efflux system)